MDSYLSSYLYSDDALQMLQRKASRYELTRVSQNSADAEIIIQRRSSRDEATRASQNAADS